VAGELPWSYKDGRVSFLPESSRTNLLLRSEEFDNAYWTKTGATVTANDAVAPDGNTTADLYAPDGNVENRIFGAIISSGAYTESIFIKKTSAWVVLLLWTGIDNNGARVWVNCETGSIGSTNTNSGSFTNVSSSVVDLGDYFRLSITSTIITNFRLMMRIVDSDNDFLYTNVGSTPVHIWGAQLEVGSFASSYIPTTDTSLTRDPDVLTVTGAQDVIGQESGAIYAEFENTDGTRLSEPGAIIVLQSTGTGVPGNRNRLTLNQSTVESGRLTFNFRTDSNNNIITDDYPLGRTRLVAKYQAKVGEVFVNGDKIPESVNFQDLEAPLTTISLGYLSGEGPRWWVNAPVYRVAIWDDASKVPDELAEEITTL
jgi:hypothetical protein